MLYFTVPENIHTSPHGRFFVLHPPPGNSSFASYIASKILASKTPLPLGICNDFPWGGYRVFQELHKNYNRNSRSMKRVGSLKIVLL